MTFFSLAESRNDIKALFDLLELDSILLSFLCQGWAFIHPGNRSLGKLTMTTGHKLEHNHLLDALAEVEEQVVLDALMQVVHVSRLEDIPVGEQGLEHRLCLLSDPSFITKNLWGEQSVDKFITE